MQLAVLLLLMLMGGNANLKEMKPLIESIDKDAAGILDRAEELGAAMSAVRAMASVRPPEKEGEKPAFSGYPLSPVAPIADEGITYALSRYITLGD